MQRLRGLFLSFFIFATPLMTHSTDLENYDDLVAEMEYRVNQSDLLLNDDVVSSIFTDRLEPLLGKLENYQRAQGVFGILSFAYHFNVPIDSSLAREYNVRIHRHLQQIRNLFTIKDDATYYLRQCGATLAAVYDGDDNAVLDSKILHCADAYKNNELFQDIGEIHNFQVTMSEAVAYAMDVAISAYYFLLPTTKTHHGAHFERVFHETTSMDEDIMTGVEELKTIWTQFQETGPPEAEKAAAENYERISKKLTDPSLPYHLLLEVNQPGLIELRRSVLESLYGKIEDAFTIRNWTVDYFAWLRYEIPTDELIDTYFDDIVAIHTEFFEVDKANASAYLWDWQYDARSGHPRNVTHNLRLAWEALDELLEEIKFHTNKTYFGNLRIEALRKAQEYGKDPNRKLFNGIGNLEYRCTNNETDLIGPDCNRENYEICAPRLLGAFEFPEDNLRGELSVVRPKTVYVHDEKTKKYTVLKAFVIKEKECHCGFRTDCGDDLGAKVNCVLQANDLYRNQCRGSIGYPCKTLPLAPGFHHESCVTGYCDMKDNSCEEGPQEEVGNYNGAPEMIVGTLLFLVVVLIEFFLSFC